MQVQDPYWYQAGHCDEAVTIEERFHRGDAELFITGVVVSLLDLTVDVLTLLLIHDYNWREKRYPLMKTEKEYERCIEIPLPRNESDLLRYKELAPEKMVVLGSAAVVLGTKLARKRIEERRIQQIGSERPDPDSSAKTRAMVYVKARTPSGKAYDRPINLAAARAITRRIISGGDVDLMSRKITDGTTKYDIIVDELARIVYVQQQDEESAEPVMIDKSNGIAWKMLWLILRNTPGRVTVDDIEEHRSDSSKISRAGYLAYPKALKKLLPVATQSKLGIRKPALPLKVPDRDFYFYWVCNSTDPEESLLLSPPSD